MTLRAALLLIVSFLFTSLLCQNFSSEAATSKASMPDFAYTQGWLGADDAYSIPLGPDRSLWLFGDTFVGTPATKLRSDAKTMVRNSIGGLLFRREA